VKKSGKERPSGYVFDRDWSRERARLESQARLLDDGTVAHLEALGARAGWRCAEIGAGAGSIARWLARRAAAACGRVVATDVDVRFLAGIEQDGLEIRVHDIVAGPLERDAYDVIHTRLLLRHLPQREQALANMLASLRPGGYLLAEDFDLATAVCFHPPSDVQAKVAQALERLLARRGVETRCGIQLVGALCSAGFVDVVAEARLRVVPLGTPDAEALALKLEHFRAALVTEGLVSDAEVDRAITEARTTGDGAVHYPPLLVAAWGRKPE
jgi:2-polyprenyl-3-methyl-5-hydroxy-6-metoxy-1,4-benzoquinol methylase